MAIKVRCQQCRRKISIDEAFAGGNCRCPYCKAITMVSVRSAVSRATRPDRPDTPTAGVSQVPPVEAVPLAKPVRVQGIITLVLSVFVLLLLLAGVFLVVKFSN
jgi:PHP family Zn ribbon phosphoesterase